MRNYAKVPIADITQEKIDACIQTSADTLRKTVDGAYCILKFEGDTPPSLVPYPLFDESTIYAEIQSAEWNNSD